MLGYLPTWAIYFTVYDSVKDWAVQPAEGGMSQNVGFHNNDLQYPIASKPRLNAWTAHILASVTAGATGTILTSPLWVVKTRFMVRYHHTLQYTSHITP